MSPDKRIISITVFAVMVIIVWVLYQEVAAALPRRLRLLIIYSVMLIGCCIPFSLVVSEWTIYEITEILIFATLGLVVPFALWGLIIHIGKKGIRIREQLRLPIFAISAMAGLFASIPAYAAIDSLKRTNTAITLGSVADSLDFELAIFPIIIVQVLFGELLGNILGSLVSRFRNKYVGDLVERYKTLVGVLLVVSIADRLTPLLIANLTGVSISIGELFSYHAGSGIRLSLVLSYLATHFEVAGLDKVLDRVVALLVLIGGIGEGILICSRVLRKVGSILLEKDDEH